MASILSLNDDCLYRIISCLYDPFSFHSIALTCKIFLQVIKSTRNILHPKLLRAKAEYYIKCYLVDITNGKKGWNSEDYDKYCELRDLLSNSVRLIAAKEILTYTNVVDVWQKNGAVAAKLFTWIRNQETSKEEGEPRATCSTEYRSTTLHLPGCDKKLVIDTSNFHDYIGNYSDELSIHITCGDLDIEADHEGFPYVSLSTRYGPDDYMHWEEDEVRAAVEPLKPVVELLQKELGETVPPISDVFFIWLCYFFPGGRTLPVEQRLSFKDPSRNEKPNPGQVQSAIDLFHQGLQAETKLKNMVSQWNKTDDQESKYPSLIAETVAVLVQRSETTFLKKLQGDAENFYRITSDYDLKLLPKPLLLDLVLRTTLESSDYRPGTIADKFVQSRASFRFTGGKVVKLWGGMHGDGRGYPSWDILRLKVTLPDDKELELDTEYNVKVNPIPVVKLSPVTELFQQGINNCMEGEKHIPTIDDRFTATYMLHALHFGREEETFLGRRVGKNLIDTESSEESLSEESEEESDEQ